LFARRILEQQPARLIERIEPLLACSPYAHAQYEQCNTVRRPNVGRVATHLQEINHLRAPAAYGCNQRASRSRSTISPCNRFSSIHANESTNPAIIMSSGISISSVIEGRSNFMSVGPWCSVVHHSTE